MTKTDPTEQSMIRLLRKAKQTRDRARGWHQATKHKRKASRLNGDTMTAPGTDINCRCVSGIDPLWEYLTTDYPGDWTPHKQGYRVKWGKVTAYVYRTGSGEEICVEMTVNREVFERKANSITYLETDGFDSCLEPIEYYFQTWHDDWIAQLFMFKDCPPKIKDFFDLTVKKELDDSQDTITQLKEQLKTEQKNLRQLNKLKGVLGL